MHTGENIEMVMYRSSDANRRTFPDSAPALVPMLEAKYNSSLRVARHRNQGVVSLQPTYAGGRRTSQAKAPYTPTLNCLSTSHHLPDKASHERDIKSNSP